MAENITVDLLDDSGDEDIMEFHINTLLEQSIVKTRRRCMMNANACFEAYEYLQQKNSMPNNEDEHFVENVIPRYTFEEFREHFRMNKSSFEVLISMLSSKEGPTYSYPLQKRLLLTIWALATPECFRSIADRFGLSRGFSHYLFMATCQEICNLATNYIQWPALETIRACSDGYFAKWRFPGAFAAIDGSHIPIKEPLEHKERYYNRKQFTSVILQAVCDEKMQFLDVHIGSPGSMHDSRVLRTSSVFTTMESISIPTDLHILGDSAYPLKVWLLTPYRDNGHLSNRQKRYNRLHSKARSVIERAFAQLKGKFRRLKYLDMSNMQYIVTVILACCVLHNFIIKMNDSQDEDTGDSQTADSQIGDDTEMNEMNPLPAAVAKRNSIAQLIQ